MKQTGGKFLKGLSKLFAAANRYIETSDWKTIAVLKFCLISLGMMTGMAIGKKARKPVFFGALGVFAATYVPLMVKFYKVLTEK